MSTSSIVLRADVVSIGALAVALVMMLGELVLSRAHERILRQRGAIEPRGDVYRILAIAYPGMFVAMAAEGVLRGPGRWMEIAGGVLVFVSAKLLKAWAISALGYRWTYRVLVPPDGVRVTSGPYAWMRHPNYVAVFGEIAGMALLVGAPVTGALSLVAFAILVKTRISVEENALGAD